MIIVLWKNINLAGIWQGKSSGEKELAWEGMAKAIIRVNQVPQNEQNLKQAMPQAVEQFASIRRDAAQKGW
jgi:hypothetical protein